MKQHFLGRLRTISWSNNWFPLFCCYPTQTGLQTESHASQVVPPGGAGTLRNFRVRANPNPLVGAAGWSLAVRKNGADAITVGIFQADGTTAKVASGEVAFAVNDKASINIVPSGGFPTDVYFEYSFEYETATSTTSVYGFGGHGSLASTGVASYQGVWAGGAPWESSTTNATDITGPAGDLTALTLKAHTAPGSGKSWTAAIILNGTLQDGSGATVDTRVVVADAATENTTTFTLPLVSGDRVATKITPSGTPTSAHLTGTSAFSASTAGEWNFAGRITGSPSTSATNYMWVVGALYTSVWTGTEATWEWEAPVSPLNLSGLRVACVTAPGASKSFDYTLRREGADTIHTVQIAGTSTVSGTSSSTPVVFAEGETLNMKAVPTGTPTSPGGVAWVFSAFLETPEEIDAADTIVVGVSEVGYSTRAVFASDSLAVVATEVATQAEQTLTLFVFGAKGRANSSRTMLVNLDDVSRLVSAEGALALGGYMVFFEQASPPSAQSNAARIYAEDNGSGKTRLMARFGTGAAQQIAIEP